MPPAEPAAGRPRTRAEALDALRGLAIAWMVGFHLSFDLNHLGWLRPAQDFYRDPFWTTQRTLIVSLFLLCAGGGQALAQAAGQGWPRFWRRWAQVLVCALAVSAGSALMFPASWISFGVLHGMALMLLLTRAWPVARGAAWPQLALPLLVALVCLALPLGLAHPVFDSRWTNWVGLVTHKPRTEDYVPLLPWWGVMLVGLVAGRWLLARRPAWLGWRPARPGLPWRLLVRLGRWPLTVYMLHQPLLIGVLTVLAPLRPAAAGG